ncbi:GGDEF domain-containing protein [Simiduia aestuariiviva]|uniref:diguanylate cyclase n=1 Tax=Simiduia aestuariiviva TaxID=1510459 RepID=A0A839UQI3_9GAMM|nr:GGDEF domain-containing protein [Simiduia aestuariiviva]MBB3167625.1 diguanylate cyclase (GGDEF)-like protein [Simiduia aestuariiviva]
MDSTRSGGFDGSENLIKAAADYANIPEFLAESTCLVLATIGLDGKLLKANVGADYVFFADFSDDTCVSNAFVNPTFAELTRLAELPAMESDGAVVFEGLINVGNPALMVHSLNGRILRLQNSLLVIAEHDVHQLINLNQKVVDLNNELANAHRKMAKLNREITAEKKRTEQLLITDQLTQAPNRFALNRRMDEEISNFERHRKPMAFALLDIDKFKSVNDEFGHDVGDEALVYLADWLKGRLRETDFFARWGGEEFVIVFANTSVDEAQLVLDRIREALASEIFEPIGRPLTFSAGILEFEYDMTLDEVFKQADKALYSSKEHGRNRITRVAKSK